MTETQGYCVLMLLSIILAVYYSDVFPVNLIVNISGIILGIFLIIKWRK